LGLDALNALPLDFFTGARFAVGLGAALAFFTAGRGADLLTGRFFAAAGLALGLGAAFTLAFAAGALA
jgi:hypothetical protein